MSGESRTARAAYVAALMVATLMVDGCAMAMLRGASSSGGGGSPASAGSSTSRSGQQAADSAISTSVRSKFAANPALKALNLTVDTHDGIVTLRGQAATVGQKNAAQSDAGAIKGVRSVQNLITVR
jgi:hyperosmotically inducible periplasmic protein